MKDYRIFKNYDCIFLDFSEYYMLSLQSKNIINMALPIASVLVLTGEVAQRFEAEAQANYQKNLNRTEQEIKAEAEALERGFAKLRLMLNKAHLGDK